MRSCVENLTSPDPPKQHPVFFNTPELDAAGESYEYDPHVPYCGKPGVGPSTPVGTRPGAIGLTSQSSEMPWASAGNRRPRGSFTSEYQRGTSTDHLPAVRSLRLVIGQELHEKAGKLFRKLFKMGWQQRDDVAAEELQFVNAEALVTAAIDEFRMNGNEERLIVAADLLEHFTTAQSIAALHSLAQRRDPEAYAFVRAIDWLPVHPEVREGLVRLFAHSPHADVRQAVAELSHGNDARGPAWRE